MNMRDKLNKISIKMNLFPEVSLRDKLRNRLVVFGVNIFNWIKNILLKIRNIFKLIHFYFLTRKKNWNLYGANPISIKVFITAIKIILHLDYQPMDISPTPNSSIKFEWENDKAYIEFEIYKSSIIVKISINNNKIKNHAFYLATDYYGMNSEFRKHFL